MRISDKTMAWTSGLSLLAHLLFATMLTCAPPMPPPPPRLVAADVRLEVADLTIPDEMEEEIEEIIDSLPPPTASPRPVPRSTRPVTTAAINASTDPPLAGTLVASTGAPSAGTIDIAPGEETEEERRIRLSRARIDPLHAAAASVLRDDPGPILPSGPAGLGPAGETVRPLSVAEAERMHDEHLGAAAATKTHLSHTRPRLEGPDANGNYTYRGHAFTATIHNDGSVSYSDRGAVEYDLGSGSGSFDLGDMVMGAAGADPRAAERTWFEEENAELIERLENEARLTARATSLRRLRGQLRLIWEDRTQSTERRRRELFDLWDQQSEDEADRPARDAVIAFIRAELPATSEDAYPDSELSSLNAGRESTERFSPY